MFWKPFSMRGNNGCLFALITIPWRIWESIRAKLGA